MLRVRNLLIGDAFSLSSEVHWGTTMNVLRKVLINSNYTRDLINEHIFDVLDELKNRGVTDLRKAVKRVKDKKDFISCPYYPGAMGFVRRTMRDVGIESVALAPSMMSNNRRLVFSNMKDKSKLNSIKNSSFYVKCAVCDFSSVLFACRYDVETTLIASLEDKDSLMFKHCEKTGHSIDINIDKN